MTDADKASPRCESSSPDLREIQQTVADSCLIRFASAHLIGNRRTTGRFFFESRMDPCVLTWRQADEWTKTVLFLFFTDAMSPV